MFRSQFFCFVVTFFILINTDLSEAYGSWSDEHNPYGLEIWLPIFIPLGVFLCCWCCMCCTICSSDDDNINETAINMHRNIVMEEHYQQHQQNNVNETAINLQPSIPQATNQFQENLPQNTYYDAKLSSTHLYYPIAPRNVLSNGPNQPNYISVTISPTYLPQPLPEWPSAPENHNLSAYDNEQNGSILSSTHRHYDPPPPYPGTPNGAWINGSWVTNHM